MKHLSAHIPIDRRHALSTNQTLPEHTTGVAIFVDISGFTNLTTMMSKKLGTHRAAEELTQILNRVYGTIIEQIHSYHGSVISFSGDAITCWFDEPYQSLTPSCATAIQAQMAQFQNLSTDLGFQLSLSVKVSLSSGNVRRFLVGNPKIKLIETLTGNCLHQLSEADKLAQKGEIILTTELATLLGEQITIQSWRQDQNGNQYGIMVPLTEKQPIQPWPEIKEIDEELISPWLLPAIHQRLQQGLGDFLTELRSVVAIFVQFGHINYDHDSDASQKLDQYIQWAQVVLERYGANILQLTIGDKGSYFYAVVGTPIAYENNVIRALDAALALTQIPPDLNFINLTKIGIGRGRARTGAYGSNTRQTYGAIGDQVNMAARLMEIESPYQILVAEQIKEEATNTHQFIPLPPTTVKGFSQQISIYALKAHKGLLQTELTTEMVGRLAELQQLNNQFQTMLSNNESYLTIVEGQAGIGKSHLVETFRRQVHAQQIPYWVGISSAVEQATPYYAWRTVFINLLELNWNEQATIDDMAKRCRLQINQYLEKYHPDEINLAPLINTVLPFNVFPEDNELTSQLVGQVRADSIHNLLVSMLQKAAQRTPLVIVLEDVHWLDSASWALVRFVQRDVKPLQLILVTRPLANPLPTEYSQLLEVENNQHININVLNDKDIEHLVCSRLGVKELPTPMIQLIHQKAEGNPFFSEEIAYALRDAGLVVINKGVCQLASHITNLTTLEFPNTIQGVITSRIDQLSPKHQLILKVASVIGRTFPLKTLCDVHPQQNEKAMFLDYLKALEKLEITPLETPEPNLSYIFRHIITHEVTYGLLLFSQRRELHQIVAQWYETEYKDNLSPFYPLLVHHWQQADNLEKTIFYLEKSGRQAFNRGANIEAVRFYETLIDLTKDEEGNDLTVMSRTDAQLRHAHWHRDLGEAYYQTGNIAKALEHLERAIILFDRPLPNTTGQLISGIFRALGRQILHRYFLTRFLGTASKEDSERLNQAVSIFQTISPIYFLMEKQGHSIYAALHQINIAELAGPSKQLVQAYGVMCIVTGLFGMTSIADKYYKHAERIANSMPQPEVLVHLYHQGGVYQVGAGLFQEGRISLQNGMEIYDNLRNKNGWRDCTIILAFLEYFASNFEHAQELVNMVTTINPGDEDTFIHWGWGVCLNAGIALRQGDFDKTLHHLAKAKQFLIKNPSPLTEVYYLGFLAMTHLRLGQLEKATVAAKGAAAIIEETKGIPGGNHVLYAYVAVAEVYQSHVNNSQEAPSQSHLDALKHACKRLHFYCRFFPIGKGNAFLHQGIYEWSQGKHDKAYKSWQKSIEWSEKYEMIYEVAQAHYYLGRYSPKTASRQAHLDKAKEIFVRVGAKYELSLLEKVN
ncbi:MAG TPA: AAA family ATPase [Anaerolineae bacterium]|nr:AAA family ATPase [Anaerolineae bacterium]